MALSHLLDSVRTKSEMWVPLRWPTRSRRLLLSVFPCSYGMFFWPSKAQSPDYTHLSTLEQTRSTLIWTGAGVLFCVRRVRCGVRCGCSSLHRAPAKMRIQVSCMDVRRAILVYVAEIQRRGAVLMQTEQGISYIAPTVNTCLLATNSGNTSQRCGQDLTRYDMT